MECSELLNELKNKIGKALYLQLDCVSYEEKIIDNQVIKNVYNKSDKIDCSNKIDDILYPLDLTEIQDVGGNINCETCQEYNYKKDKINLIHGYLDSSIVICKLNNDEYKIDTYMKQVDYKTNLEYETNIQYKVRLVVE